MRLMLARLGPARLQHAWSKQLTHWLDEARKLTARILLYCAALLALCAEWLAPDLWETGEP